jgi:predicted transposase/invertase (TIGR01784 family)
MQFADVKNDIAFRKIFGNENRTESLISFLNAILAFEGERQIRTVTLLNPYQLPLLSRGKSIILDIRATDQAGRIYLVEMQVAETDGFDKRVLYYFSRAYSEQIERGDFYRDLKPVIFIGILDFVHTANPHYLSRSQVQDVETGERTLHDMEFTFIELPKFSLTPESLKTLTEKWIYFIKNAENLDVIPANVDDEGLRSAYLQANKHTWTREELTEYDYLYMREEDERARFDAAMKKAVRFAEEQTRLAEEQTRLAEEQTRLAEEKVRTAEEQTRMAEEKVGQERNTAIAMNLIRLGMDNRLIAEATGLTPEQIQTLRLNP